MIDKRQTILAATRLLLAKHGFHGFSMKQLATQAEVAAGTLYLYFKDKDDLIRQLHEQILVDVATEIFTDHDSTKPLFEQYHQLWHKLWFFCIKHPDIVMVKDQFDHLPPDVQQTQYAQALKLFSPLMDIFKRGKQQKILKSLPDDVLSSLSIETCSALARKQILGLIKLNKTTLETTITANWDAIAV